MSAMRLSAEEVRKVAGLARLKLSPADVDRYTRQLGNILEYVRQLQSVETAGVEPLAHPHPLCNVFREDIPSASLPREAALRNAPRTDGRYFLVPQILDQP